MLVLKRMTLPNELRNCDASGKVLMYGDFYYEDTEDGTIIDAKYYKKLKADRKKESWDYSTLENAKNEVEYQKELKKAEQEFLSNRILDDYEVY